MKYTVAIFAAVAAVVNGQAQCEPAAESIPACALGYIASAASANHGCGLLDFACQCQNSAALVGELAGPLGTACTAGGGLNDVLSAVGGVCSCVSSNSGAEPLAATPASCITQAAAIPACALGYLASAGKQIGQCSIQDFACQCSNFQAIQATVAGDVAKACTAGINDVIQSANALCSCAGGSGGSGSSGSGSGSGSPSASATGSGSGTSKPSGSGSGSATTGGSGTSAPKATSSAKPSGGAGSPSVFTGAAAVPAAVGGGVLAFVGGLVAML